MLEKNDQTPINDSQNDSIEEKNPLAQEVLELKDKLLRNAAEMENLRKRCEKQIEEARDFAVTNFAKDLIGVIDNMHRALQHKPAEINPEVQNIIQGVEMILNEFSGVLKKHHIHVIETNIGDDFNHHHHYAIAQVPTEQFSKGKIVNVMQIGYKLKDRLLRPTSVVIAADKEEK